MEPWNVSNAVYILSRTAFARVVNAASDMPTTWAADARHFALNVVALLAFTAFAIACIVIVGIKQVNCAVRDQHIAISVLQCPVSPRKFPTLAPCQSCARIVVRDRGPTKKSVAVQPAKFNCRPFRPFLTSCLRSFYQRTFGRIFACTTCLWLWHRWVTKLAVCLMACSCSAAKHVTKLAA